MQDQILNVVNRIMKTQGVTQSQLASALGCSQTSISQLINGKVKLTIEDLTKIASILRVPIVDIVDEASNLAPIKAPISTEANNFACEDELNFQIFNRLKVPQTLLQLSSDFPIETAQEIRKRIARLREMEILVEDMDGRLVLLVPDAASIHFEINDAYNSRINEIFRRSRSDILKIANAPTSDLKLWKEKNVDALYIDYFTDEQAYEITRNLRQFLDFLKHQLRINRIDRNKFNPNSNSSHCNLRTIFISNIPCPSTRQQ